jgi:hypothetical protein
VQAGGGDTGRAEFRPDPGSIGRAQRGQLSGVAWAGALSVMAASSGAALGGGGWSTLLGFAAAAVGLGLVATMLLRHRRLGRVLRDGQVLVVHAGGLVLPGEPPVSWFQVAAVVAHRLGWAGLEITLHSGRRVRVLATHFGTTVDALVGAVGRYVPVGDPDAAYRQWGEYWSGG